MVKPEGLGHETDQEDRHEEGESRHRPQDRRYSALPLGRRHYLCVGTNADCGLITKHDYDHRPESRRRWCPAGTVVVVTSVNRLAAVLPHSAQHVEAPDPDIIMRR